MRRALKLRWRPATKSRASKDRIFSYPGSIFPSTETPLGRGALFSADDVVFEVIKDVKYNKIYW
jgi:hypothetical protein